MDLEDFPGHLYYLCMVSPSGVCFHLSFLWEVLFAVPDSLQESVLQGVWQCGCNTKRFPVKVGEKALVSITTPAWLPHKNRIMAYHAAGQSGRSYLQLQCS